MAGHAPRHWSTIPPISSNRVTGKMPEPAKPVLKSKVFVLLFWELEYFVYHEKDWKT